MKKAIIVVCEGNSERAYIQKLNRYLRENDYPFTFQAQSVGCGHYKEVVKKYKKEQKGNRRTEILIWVDKDIYVRNERNNRDQYDRKPRGIPDFLFSCMNFEDFISLHDTVLLSNWHQTCLDHNHFDNPMNEATYMPLWEREIAQNYKKGSMPFSIDDEKLETLFSNLQENGIRFRCGFADYLRNLLQNHPAPAA